MNVFTSIFYKKIHHYVIFLLIHVTLIYKVQMVIVKSKNSQYLNLQLLASTGFPRYLRADENNRYFGLGYFPLLTRVHIFLFFVLANNYIKPLRSEQQIARADCKQEFFQFLRSK